MASSPLSSHITHDNAVLIGRLDNPRWQTWEAYLLTPKKAEELYFNETDVTALFKNMNYKIHLRTGLLQIYLSQNLGIPDTTAKPNMIRRPACSEMARLHSPHPQVVSQVCFEQP